MAKQYSGRNIGLFIAKESSFGVKAKATACLKQTGFTGGMTPEYVDSASRLGSRAAAGQYPSSRIGKLSVPAEMDPENLGFFLKALCGKETVTQIGTTGAYKHTFEMLNDAGLPSWTLVRQYGWMALDSIGSVLNALSMSIAPKAIVTGTAEFIFKTENNPRIEFGVADVSTANGTITIEDCPFLVNDPVRFFPPASGNSLPSPLVPCQTYYVKTVVGDAITLAATSGGAVIALTTAGTGANYVIPWEVIEPTKDRPFLYRDGFIKVNGVLFGECRNSEFNFSNNISTDDFRLNYGGEIATLPGGSFDASGKMTVVMNEESYPLREMYLDGEECALEVILETGIQAGTGSATYGLSVAYARAQLGSGDPGVDENGMLMDMSIKAFAAPVSPVVFVLTNERSGAY